MAKEDSVKEMNEERRGSSQSNKLFNAFGISFKSVSKILEF
jgi:hypothetical protein